MKKANKMLAILSVITLFGSILSGCSQTSQSSADKGQDQPKKQTAAPKTDYPNKPIELVVPYAAGGGTDVIARALANAASKYLPHNQPITVANKPGASGTVGLAEMLTAKPDGYKLSMATIGNLGIQPNYGKTPYTYNSFQPIMVAVAVPHVLVVKKDAQWKNVDEWLDYVKKNPNAFKYSTPGAGNTQHLNMLGINLKDGLQSTHVPFDGAAPALTALLGGHVDGSIVQSFEAKPYVDSGQMRVLANTGTRKSDAFPDVPLLAERGYIGFDAWTGIVAPKGLPQEQLKILNDAFKKALEDPEVVEQFKKVGISAAYSGPEDFAKIIEDTYKSSGDVAKKAGLVK